MRVLCACEFSQIVTSAFRERGHDAWSCDILPSEGKYPEHHLQQDVLEVLDRDWDMMIGHPECRFLANSGCKWLYKSGKKENGRDEERWENMRKGAEFFLKLKNADIPRIAIENPIPHGYALEYMGPYSQIIQPWQFGHTENKKTALWLKGLPLLQETNNVKALMKDMPKRETDKVHYMSPGKDRGKRRSVFFEGIGEAMADQWSNIER
jgi:hypothetical protein